jgi:hypothetical protein
MTNMNTHDLAAESNRIEGIDRPLTEAEIRGYEQFVRPGVATNQVVGSQSRRPSAEKHSWSSARII